MATASRPVFEVREDASQVIRRNFELAQAQLKLEARLVEALTTSFRELTVRFPVTMDDGNLQLFTGHRVQHNNARGPFLGAVRVEPTVSIADLRALAESVTYTAALLEVPFGGAYAGVECSPEELTAAELERLTQKFSSRMQMGANPFADVVSPDAVTLSNVVDWIASDAGTKRAAVTGKREKSGGLSQREQIAGAVVALLVSNGLADLSIPVPGARVAIQGFGDSGVNAAIALNELGCKLVAVCDSKQGIYNPDGLKLKDLLKLREKGRALSDYSAAVPVTVDEVIATSCDVLVTCGAECAIHNENAASVRAKLLIEATNLAITPAADRIFAHSGVVVVPDLLAASGNVLASWFEWDQNLANKKPQKPELAAQAVQSVVSKAYRKAAERACKDAVPLRTACYELAMERIARMERLRAA